MLDYRSVSISGLFLGCSGAFGTFSSLGFPLRNQTWSKKNLWLAPFIASMKGVIQGIVGCTPTNVPLWDIVGVYGLLSPRIPI